MPDLLERRFYVRNESWYFKYWADEQMTDQVTHEISFGFYQADGGGSGDLVMRWYLISNGDGTRQEHPRLEVFDDGWSSLAQLPELIAALGAASDQKILITPPVFVAMLSKMGFADATERVRGETFARRGVPTGGAR